MRLIPELTRQDISKLNDTIDMHMRQLISGILTSTQTPHYKTTLKPNIGVERHRFFPSVQSTHLHSEV